MIRSDETVNMEIGIATDCYFFRNTYKMVVLLMLLIQ